MSDLVPFHESSDDAIDEALREARVGPGDVFVDLGAGNGKVVAAAAKTGAVARGIEIQPALAALARAKGLDVVCADAREAQLEDGTVFYLYVPFTGAVLQAVLTRLHDVAKKHPIRICTLSLDLAVPWLEQRPLESFWLAVYDSKL